MVRSKQPEISGLFQLASGPAGCTSSIVISWRCPRDNPRISRILVISHARPSCTRLQVVFVVSFLLDATCT